MKFPLIPQQKAHKSCRRVSPSDSDPRQDLLWPQDFQAATAQHQPVHPVPITPSIPLVVFIWSPSRKPSAGDHSVHREQAGTTLFTGSRCFLMHEVAAGVLHAWL